MIVLCTVSVGDKLPISRQASHPDQRGAHCETRLYYGSASFPCSTLHLIDKLSLASKDGNRSDSHGIGFGYHFLLYFKSNMDTDSDIFGSEYKTDASDSDSTSYHILN